MSRALDAQTFGSLVVIGAFAAAEGAAAFLSLHPGSEAAWYLNLAVFRPFELARAETSPLRGLFGPAALPGALLLLAATLAFRACRFRFGVAAIANLCFSAAATLAYLSLNGGAPARAAGLLPPPALQGPDSVVIGLMLGSSALAFAVSHLSLFGLIRAERRARA